MRSLSPRPFPPPPLAPARPSGYDWTRLGIHTLRVSAGSLIDFPLAISAASQPWIATLWPNPRANGGWCSWAWQPDPVQGRGWLLPDRLTCGDVLEFGVNDRAQNGAATSRRWWGIFDAYLDGWRLTVQGPYAAPGDAHADAERLLALDRYQPPKTTNAPSRPVTCTRAGRSHR